MSDFPSLEVSTKFSLRVISFLEEVLFMGSSRLMVYFDCDKLLLILALDFNGEELIESGR